LKVPASWKPTLNPGLNGEFNPDWNYLKNCAIGSIGFYLAASLFVYSASYFNDFDTGKYSL